MTGGEEAPAGNRHGTGQKDGTWGNKRPGKGGSHDGKHDPQEPQWQCVTAPCGPPRAAANEGRTHPA